MKRRKDQVFTAHGKIDIDRENVRIIHERKRYSYLRSYYCMLLERDIELESIDTLSHLGLRVFLALARNVHENIVYIPIEKLAKDFSLDDRSIYRALSDLRKHKLVYRERKSVYILNPSVVWKGDDEEYLEALKNWSEKVNGFSS